MEAIHRVLTGSTLTSGQLKIAGIIVIAWIAIDVIQFSDWVYQKINPSPVTVICK